MIEAAAGVARLPSVKSTPASCVEWSSITLAAELSFFERLGLDIAAVQVEVPLRPGDLLVFDNLALAHGRRGSRKPGELHQRSTGTGRSPRRLSAHFATASLRCSRASAGSAALGHLRSVGRDEVSVLAVDSGVKHPI